MFACRRTNRALGSRSRNEITRCTPDDPRRLYTGWKRRKDKGGGGAIHATFREPLTNGKLATKGEY